MRERRELEEDEKKGKEKQGDPRILKGKRRLRGAAGFSLLPWQSHAILRSRQNLPPSVSAAVQQGKQPQLVLFVLTRLRCSLPCARSFSACSRAVDEQGEGRERW